MQALAMCFVTHSKAAGDIAEVSPFFIGQES
jgi:hypothetical protein